MTMTTTERADGRAVDQLREITIERGWSKQAEGSALQVLLSGARRSISDAAAKLTADAGLTLQNFERLDSAVAHALERAGHLLMRRS